MWYEGKLCVTFFILFNPFSVVSSFRRRKSTYNPDLATWWKTAEDSYVQNNKDLNCKTESEL